MIVQKRVVTYERVSTDQQRERASILTQHEELLRKLEDDQGREIVGRYVDDGVSGAVLLAERPAGARLLRDARLNAFDEVWVYRLDRLGRDDVDPIITRRELAKYGIRLISLNDNAENDLEFAIRVAFAAEERRVVKRRTSDGMSRLARDGRYCGGVVAYGYRLDDEGRRIVPSAEPACCHMNEADVVRYIFQRVGVDRWTCPKVAADLNALGIPTAYQREGRGMRRQRTRGVWRPGRVRNLLVNPVYRGELTFGKRTKDIGRELFTAPVEQQPADRKARVAGLPAGRPSAVWSVWP